MERGEFQRKIRASWQFLGEEMGIARTVISLVSLKIDAAYNEIALDAESSYRDIYLVAMSRSYYNIILNDYSIFQYSWRGDQSWRLAYLPNPWIAGVAGAESLIQEWEALESLGALDQEEVAGLISELPYHSSIPAIRFEYAADQYRELAHPAAHLHIGRHTENRWPLARLLNPLTFSMAIAKFYYSTRWAQLSTFHGHAVEDCLDLRFIEELRHSRLVHEFSEDERRSLHMASQSIPENASA
jgi:hypothetical protein